MSRDQVMGVLAAASIALGGWALLGISDAKSRIAVEESKSAQFEKAVDKLDDKLTEILKRLSPTPEWRSRRALDGTDSTAAGRRPVPDSRSVAGGP